MIARVDVDRLAERAPTPESPVLSVHLDVDQSRGEPERRVRRRAEGTVRAVEQQLAESARPAFHADAERVQRFVAEYAPRARTLVVFADDSADLFWTGELRIALPTDVRWEPTPYLRPLFEPFDEHERVCVVLAGKEHARVFSIHLGEIEEESETLAGAEVRHKRASGTDHWRSQMQFQRQDDMHVRWHLRRAVELLEDGSRPQAFDRLVLVGPVEATSELARLLPRPLAGRVVGTLRLPVEAPAEEVLRETLELAERAEREAEKTRVAEVLDRGARGLDATLAALQTGPAPGTGLRRGLRRAGCGVPALRGAVRTRRGSGLRLLRRAPASARRPRCPHARARPRLRRRPRLRAR